MVQLLIGAYTLPRMVANAPNEKQQKQWVKKRAYIAPIYYVYRGGAFEGLRHISIVGRPRLDSGKSPAATLWQASIGEPHPIAYPCRMAPLQNARWEAFCRAVARGEAASRSYASIYHVSGRTAEVNGSKLLRNAEVTARIAELKNGAARRTEKTVESLVADLDETIAFAKECKNPAAMVAAINAQARLLGLVVDRSEVTVAHRPAPLPTKLIELSESEWIAQFGSGTGPKPALTNAAKQRKAGQRKTNGGDNRDAVAAPTIEWDADTASIRGRGVITLDD